MLELISQMIRTRYSHLFPVQSSLVLLRGMTAEPQSNSSCRVFQVTFNDDVLDEQQVRGAARFLCLPAYKDPRNEAEDYNGYKLTSLAVWKLSEDAECIEAHCAEQSVFSGEKAQEARLYCSHFVAPESWECDFTEGVPELGHDTFCQSHVEEFTPSREEDPAMRYLAMRYPSYRSHFKKNNKSDRRSRILLPLHIVSVIIMSGSLRFLGYLLSRTLEFFLS
jgi:hypothetical protein